jgi:hypothetical protein
MGLINQCPQPTLHDVSAFGTKLSFYEYPKNSTIFPACIQDDEHYSVDTAPMERWGCDAMQCEGGNKLKTLLEGIKEARKKN